jgi:hypothetical protein
MDTCNINNDGTEKSKPPGGFCNTKKGIGPADLIRKNFDPNTGNKILTPKQKMRNFPLAGQDSDRNETSY